MEKYTLKEQKEKKAETLYAGPLDWVRRCRTFEPRVPLSGVGKQAAGVAAS